MLLADQKLQENICEYIIYMYQSEALLRLYKFDMAEFHKYVTINIPDTKEAGEALMWYMGVAEQMQKEELEKEGHLESVQDKVEELSAMSKKLLNEGHQAYTHHYEKALPYIKENLSYADGLIIDDIQICINAVYGYFLARMDDNEVDKNTQAMMDAFGNVLSFLTAVYHDKASK